MPTYVYECRACSKQFEVDQRITADALTDCEACGTKGSLRRLIQPVGVSFKGAGFHINDYATKPTESSAPAAEPTVATAESSPAPVKESEVGSQEAAAPVTDTTTKPASP